MIETKIIVFLCDWYTDYFHNCLIYFSQKHDDLKLLVIDDEPDKNAPYEFDSTEKLEIKKLSHFKSTKDLISYLKSLNLCLIYTHGWSNKTYFKTAKFFYAKIPTIVGIDNPWKKYFSTKPRNTLF